MEKKAKGVMKRILAAALSTTMILTAMTACGKKEEKSDGGAYSGTMYIGQSSWIGYAPLFIAQEKGFFKNHGSTIEVKEIQSAADRRAALVSNQIQAMSSTVDTHIMSNAAGVDIVQILAMDTSCGGDGLISLKKYTKLEDLVGKKVALDTSGGASFFWFQYLLQQKGLKLSDIDVQSMGAGDAGTAFVAGKVDAAVTWQPWLTKANNTEFGHTMISSTETPGIIVDSIGVKKDFIDKYPKTVQALVDGWYDALDYMKTNPDDANKIMAEKMGMTVDEFKASLSEVKYYDEAGNIEYFGTADKKGPIYDIAKKASDLWLAEKLIDTQPDLNSVISSEFVKKN